MAYKLDGDESVVTAYADRHAGPGWRNAAVWVVVMDANKRLRRDCIQQDEMTDEMLVLFDVSHSAHKSMASAVLGAARRK